MGCAKDIVRTAIRNSPLVNISRDPDVIYTILRQHFGEPISSATPLADFYSTLPKPSESSFDYWIRLNKAVDLANECLQRQGKHVEDPSHEATMMFVKHCPDAALYAALRGKPIEKWTAEEIQEMIDSHQRDKLCSMNNREQCIAKVEEERESGAWCMSQQPIACQGAMQITPKDDQAIMGRLISLLEKLVLNQKQDKKRGKGRAADSPTTTPCKVCGESTHSTQSHCIREGLCFHCHRSGHRGFECPECKAGKEESAVDKTKN